MIAGHLYWHTNGNWGDKVLGIATRKLFNEFIPELEFNIIPVQKITESLIYNINQNDILVIGGGGMMLWMGHFIKQTDFLKKIKIPIIVYGIGLNNFKENKIGYGAKNLELLKEKCLFISVRMDGTAQQIKEDNNITFRESPPPCLWVSRYIKCTKIIPDDYIIVTPAGDVSKSRFKSFEDARNKLNNIVKELSKQYKIQILKHRIKDNDFCLPSYNDFITKEENKNPIIGISYYQHAKFVIGMRGHSQIIPFSYGVPTISISTQRKIKCFAETMGVSKFNIEEDDPDIVEKILKLSKQTDEQKPILQDNLNKIWKITTNDFKEIKKKINSIK